MKKKLTTLESYLAKRGVIRERGNVGGASYKNIPIDSSYIDFLNQQTDYILSTVRNIPFGKGYEFHTGIDIDAAFGTPVVATADGVVKAAGYYGDYGNMVLIEHASGYATLYAHLSEIKVKVGERVKAGEVLGKVGSTGRSTGPHLHYEILYQGKHKNPMDYLVWR